MPGGELCSLKDKTEKCLTVLFPISFVWSFSDQIFPKSGGKEGCGRFAFNFLFTPFLLAICQDMALG